MLFLLFKILKEKVRKMDHYEEHWRADSDPRSSIHGFERQLCQFMSRGWLGFQGSWEPWRTGLPGPTHPCTQSRAGAIRQSREEYFSIFIHSCENHMHAKISSLQGVKPIK